MLCSISIQLIVFHIGGTLITGHKRPYSLASKVHAKTYRGLGEREDGLW